MASATPIPTGSADLDAPYPVSRRHAWLTLAMAFGLMLSDYVSRQVINPVFPLLKAEWALSDSQLGSLVSVVALTIGLTSIPISLMADRFGRVKCATVMALVWSAATVACGMSDSFLSLLTARSLVGLGEAGWGSAGAAIVASAFPRRLHSTAMGAYLSAAMIGSVLGVVAGGFVAQSLGWEMAFILAGAFGLVLAILFRAVVKEPPSGSSNATAKVPVRQILANLVTTPTLLWIALGGGFTLFVQASFVVWLPSYLNRYYGFDPAKAAAGTGILILCAGLGMMLGGALVDRLSRHDDLRRFGVCMFYGVFLTITLLSALVLEPGMGQFVLIGLGLLVSASFLGPVLAAAAAVTPATNHATTFAVLSLAYMLIGMAPGPFVTGWIAEITGLKTALLVAPAGGMIGAMFFYLASRTYRLDRERLRGA